jgi:hypothetical protein
MAEVIYTDLNKYVIIHVVKWRDPKSGDIKWMEYRFFKMRPPGMGCYVERRLIEFVAEYGAVYRGPMTMSIRELQLEANVWKDDAERSIPQQVVDELNDPTYEVVLQFLENEGDDRHLVEIRKYANDDHQLWRDRQLLKRLNSEEFEMELQLKKQWETERKVEPGVGTLLSALVKYAE